MDRLSDSGRVRFPLWVAWIVDLSASRTQVGKDTGSWTWLRYGLILTEQPESRLQSFWEHGPPLAKSAAEKRALGELAKTTLEPLKSDSSSSELLPRVTTKVLPAFAAWTDFFSALFGGAGSESEGVLGVCRLCWERIFKA